MNNMNINSAIADTLDIGNTDTEKKTGLIGFYNYTVVLTYIGMWIGFLGIMLAIKDRYVGSLICLMLAGVCDMFDGTIASTKKDRTRDERTFGIQIDSLSDIICFGVLPAVWVFCVTPKISIAFTAIFVFILCGLIRLAYFNVDEPTGRQRQQSADSIIWGFQSPQVRLLSRRISDWRVHSYTYTDNRGTCPFNHWHLLRAPCKAQKAISFWRGSACRYRSS